MKLPLKTHRQHLNTVKQQRLLLDQSYARVVALAVLDGYSISDLLAEKEPSEEFDL